VSVDIATSSAITQRPYATGLGNSSRQTRASPRPVAMPSLAERIWMRIAIRLAVRITHSSR